jgi:ketosteroid isomerase-like protein
MKKIIDLEKRGWDALSTEGEAAAVFYSSMLLDDAVFLFPGGMRIEGKEDILASFAAQPWNSYQIEDPKVSKPAEGISVLTYRVTAEREGGDIYKALISSTYIVVDGDWKLGHHQHTLA